MTPLPFDYSRCQPLAVADKCRNCKRWWHHPEQKNHPFMQSVVNVTGPKDKACVYVPISLEKS